MRATTRGLCLCLMLALARAVQASRARRIRSHRQPHRGVILRGRSVEYRGGATGATCKGGSGWVLVSGVAASECMGAYRPIAGKQLSGRPTFEKVGGFEARYLFYAGSMWVFGPKLDGMPFEIAAVSIAASPVGVTTTWNAVFGGKTGALPGLRANVRASAGDYYIASKPDKEGRVTYKLDHAPGQPDRVMYYRPQPREWVVSEDLDAAPYFLGAQTPTIALKLSIAGPKGLFPALLSLKGGTPKTEHYRNALRSAIAHTADPLGSITTADVQLATIGVGSGWQGLSRLDVVTFVAVTSHRLRAATVAELMSSFRFGPLLEASLRAKLGGSGAGVVVLGAMANVAPAGKSTPESTSAYDLDVPVMGQHTAFASVKAQRSACGRLHAHACRDNAERCAEVAETNYGGHLRIQSMGAKWCDISNIFAARLVYAQMHGREVDLRADLKAAAALSDVAAGANDNGDSPPPRRPGSENDVLFLPAAAGIVALTFQYQLGGP
eukprot:g2249.t1